MTIAADAPPTKKPERAALTFILVTAFLNLTGIGLLGPVTPFLTARYLADPAQLAIVNGWLFTAYSLFQFLAVPTLGALSDRFGRRPVLLLCLFGSAVGYLLFGIGGSLAILFAGRIIDGVTGGNYGIILAYIADLTEPKDRARYFGMVGAVSGFGFVVGPAIGAALGRIGPEAPAYFAALVTLANTVWGYFAMPESLVAERRSTGISLQRLNPFVQLFDVFRLKQLQLLLLGTFLWIVPFAMLQSNLSVYGKDRLGATQSEVSLVFTIIGLTGIIVQGVLLPRLARRNSEARLATAGFLGLITAFIMFATIEGAGAAWIFYVAACIFAVGNGLVTPMISSLTSQAVGPREQGRVQGGSQSVQALARVIGPVIAGFVYTTISHPTPYLLGMVLFTLALAAVRLSIPAVLAARTALQQGG